MWAYGDEIVLKFFMLKHVFLPVAVPLCLAGQRAADWQATFDVVKVSPAVPLQLAFFPLVWPGSADVFYSQEVSDN